MKEKAYDNGDVDVRDFGEDHVGVKGVLNGGGEEGSES